MDGYIYALCKNYTLSDLEKMYTLYTSKEGKRELRRFIKLSKAGAKIVGTFIHDISEIHTKTNALKDSSSDVKPPDPFFKNPVTGGLPSSNPPKRI